MWDFYIEACAQNLNENLCSKEDLVSISEGARTG
jgi:hypothetical protein